MLTAMLFVHLTQQSHPVRLVVEDLEEVDACVRHLSNGAVTTNAGPVLPNDYRADMWSAETLAEMPVVLTCRTDDTLDIPHMPGDPGLPGEFMVHVRHTGATMIAAV